MEFSPPRQYTGIDDQLDLNEIAQLTEDVYYSRAVRQVEEGTGTDNTSLNILADKNVCDLAASLHLFKDGKLLGFLLLS